MQQDISHSARLLEHRELFTFDGAGLGDIASFFAELESELGAGAEVPTRLLRELAVLTAAEFALAPILVEPHPVLPVLEPIDVPRPACRLALMKANCISLTGCVELHEEGPELTLYDVTAFSGDVSKLVHFDVSPEQPSTQIGDVARAVAELEAAHGSSHAPSRSRAVADSGVLRLQGFLWALKLTLPEGGLEQAFEDAYTALGLGQPSVAAS